MRFTVVGHYRNYRYHRNRSLVGSGVSTVKIAVLILMSIPGCCSLLRSSASLALTSRSPSPICGWWARETRATITAAGDGPRRDACAASLRPAQGFEMAGRRHGGDYSGAAASFRAAEAKAPSGGTRNCGSGGGRGERSGKHGRVRGRRSTCRRPPYSPLPSPAAMMMMPDDCDAGRGRRDEETPTVGVGGRVGDGAISGARTRYTIDDATCPPADPRYLADVVARHCHTLDRYLENKPVAAHTAEAFQVAKKFVRDFYDNSTAVSDVEGGGGIVLDSGCGTGRSTVLLGEMYPDSVVIGVDRSLARLGRGGGMGGDKGDDTSREARGDDDDDVGAPLWRTVPDRPNVLLLRAELSDFWRCCLLDGIDDDDLDAIGDDNEDDDNGGVGRSGGASMWQIRAHYLLYPNPYPKKKRLKNRWYAHPSFPLILLLGGDEIVVRSNWEGYLREFASAVQTVASLGASTSLAQSEDEAIPGVAWTSDGSPLTSPHSIQRAATRYVESAEMGPRRLSMLSSSSLEGMTGLGGRDHEHGAKTDPRVVPMTNFEAKYAACGEAVYELRLTAGTGAGADANAMSSG